MDAVIDTLGQSLIGLLFSPLSRTFWPFLIGATAIAVLARTLHSSQSLRPDQNILSKFTWLSRSAINDYGLLILNTLIVTFLFSPFFPNAEANVALVVNALEYSLPPMAQQSHWWAPILLAACLFVIDDFIRFTVHYCEHRIPVFWELHKVHHSATALNFITAERHHPLSIVIFQFAISFGFLVVNTAFILLLDDKISPTALLGGNVFWIATNMIGGVLRHSPVWVSFGPRIEHWLISPAQHQIHHSDDEKHFDRNFGGSLAIWDWMFGTLYVTSAEREDIRYGLGTETQIYNSLWDLYRQPILKIGELFALRKQMNA